MCVHGDITKRFWKAIDAAQPAKFNVPGTSVQPTEAQSIQNELREKDLRKKLLSRRYQIGKSTFQNE